MRCRYHGTVAERSASHVPSLYIGTETKVQTGLPACPPVHPRGGVHPHFCEKNKLSSSGRSAFPSRGPADTAKHITVGLDFGA